LGITAQPWGGKSRSAVIKARASDLISWTVRMKPADPYLPLAIDARSPAAAQHQADYKQARHGKQDRGRRIWAYGDA
jgi:hypothetical protein